MRWQVTPCDQATADLRLRVERLARAWQGVALPRKAVDWARPAVVVGREAIRVRVEGRDFLWHPGLLHTRREAGARHPLVRMVEPRATDVILDVTLGLGTDATFLAELSGARVIGLEASPVLAAMAAEGLRGRVSVVCAEASSFLRGLPDGAVDVVYADPLFPEGSESGSSLDLVRRLGLRDGWSADWVAQARRVARRWVVMKDACGGSRLEALGAPEVLTRRRTRYGRWRGGGA